MTNSRKVCNLRVLTREVNKKKRGKNEMIRTEAKYKRRRLAVVVVFIALIVWALDATTPEMCKVPTEQMNQFCLDLLYP